MQPPGAHMHRLIYGLRDTHWGPVAHTKRTTASQVDSEYVFFRVREMNALIGGQAFDRTLLTIQFGGLPNRDQTRRY